MPDERFPPSDARAQEIADRAAARVLHDTFRLLGIDLSEMNDVNNLRDDFRFVRRQRSDAETRRTEAFKSATTAFFGGLIGMLLSALTWLVTTMRHPS